MQTVGRYQIKGRLGKGAMALVLRAFDPRFKREVALKVLHRRFANNPVIRQRFLREAQAIARLEHPAIVPVYDFGQDGDFVYLATRLMEGGTLGDRIAKGSMDIEEIIPVIDRIGSALDYAHQQGFIHRDVKPDNILFDQFGQPYLVDFGIVRLEESQGTLTVDSLIGTPAYMSPEQVNGDDRLNGRSDLYSLGIVLFEMLTGDVPYKGDTVMRTAMKHVLADIPRLSKRDTRLATRWQPVIDRILAKQPDERYQTGAELSAAVKAMGTQAGGRERRFSPIVFVVAGVGLIVVVFLLFYAVFNTRANSQAESLDATRTAEAVSLATVQAESAANLQGTQDAFALTAEANEGELSQELRQTQEAMDAALAQLTQQAIEAQQTQEAEAEAMMEKSELDCTDSANYHFTISEIALEPPIGTTLSAGDEPLMPQASWTLTNDADACPLSNIELQSLEDKPVPRMVLADSAGAPVFSLLPGAEAQLTLVFDEAPSTPFSDQWVFVVEDAAGGILVLEGAPTLTMAVDGWVVVATATNTPRPNNTPRPTTRPPATATPNWNATLTAEATDTPRPSNTPRPTNTPNWSQTQTVQAQQTRNAIPSATPNWSATQTVQAQQTQAAQPSPTQSPQPTRTPTQPPPSCPDMDNDGICDDDDDDRDGDGILNSSDLCADEYNPTPCGCAECGGDGGGGGDPPTPDPCDGAPPGTPGCGGLLFNSTVVSLVAPRHPTICTLNILISHPHFSLLNGLSSPFLSGTQYQAYSTQSVK